MKLSNGCGCGSSGSQSRTTGKGNKKWIVRYVATIALLSIVWWAIYSHMEKASDWLVFKVLGLEEHSHFGAALEFFLYDTVKILLLLVALIYVMAWIRTTLNADRVRDFLAGRKKAFGYMLGAIFGAVTPFCSCSSVPLFLGFTSAGIPIGVTMSFLITSPLVNELAVVLLWGVLGWKFTLVYVTTGLIAGIIGGFFMDSIKAGRWLQPFVQESIKHQIRPLGAGTARTVKVTVYQRHVFAWGEMSSILKRVWKWVVIGVAIGALLHGVVPANWFAEHFGAGQWWTVPAAVFFGIPLYTNVTGIVPVMEGLLVKGMPVGTTMAFCMSAVAASLPEVLMLRQVMTIKLQAAFIGYLWVMFTLTGWMLNALQGKLF